MKIITLLNEKGGVGKTTLATHIAAGLAIRGARVFLMDADPQANSTFNMRASYHDGLFRVVAQDAEWNENMIEVASEVWAGDYPTDTGRLLLLPSAINNRLIPLAVSETDLLAERLDEMRPVVDVVIVDTSPTPSMLHAMLYRASDHIILPTHFEAFSLQGLGNTAGRVRKEMGERESLGLPSLHLMGVQPTQFEGNTNAHTWGRNLTEEHFGEALVWEPIVKRTAWRDAQNAQRTIFAECPGTKAEIEAWGLIDRVMQAVTV